MIYQAGKLISFGPKQTTAAAMVFSLTMLLVWASPTFAQSGGRGRPNNAAPAVGALTRSPSQPIWPGGRGRPNNASPAVGGQVQPAANSTPQDQGGRSDRDDRRAEARAAEISRAADDSLAKLEALDTNKNGRLEPAEATGMSSAVLQRVGLDPNKPVSFSTLGPMVKQADLRRLRYGKDSGIDPDTAEQGVPSFQVDLPARSPIPQFGVSTHPALQDSRPLEERYSNEILTQLRSTMQQYDRNTDKTLDPEEIKLIPWGSPSPDESDLDKNGFLSEVELCERFQARTKGGSSSSRGNVSSSKATPKAAEAKPGEAASPSRPASRTRETRRTPTVSRSAAPAGDRTATYVQALLKKYDASGDNQLDDIELKNMRSRPPKSADSDNDKLLSYNELYIHYGGGASPASGDGKAAADEGGQGREKTIIPGAITWEGAFDEPKNDPTELPSSLASKDANKDGQVSMAEYSKEWDESKIQDYYKLDADKDGFITIEEANGRSGSSSVRGTSASSGSTSASTRGRSRSRGTTSKAAVSPDVAAPSSGSGAPKKSLPNSIRYSSF